MGKEKREKKRKASSRKDAAKDGEPPAKSGVSSSAAKERAVTSSDDEMMPPPSALPPMSAPPSSAAPPASSGPPPLEPADAETPAQVLDAFADHMQEQTDEQRAAAKEAASKIAAEMAEKWAIDKIPELEFDEYTEGDNMEAYNRVAEKGAKTAKGDMKRLRITTPPGYVERAYIEGTGSTKSAGVSHGKDDFYRFDLVFGDTPELYDEHKPFIEYMEQVYKDVYKLVFLCDSIRPGDRERRLKTAEDMQRRYGKLSKDDPIDKDAQFADALEAHIDDLGGKLSIVEKDGRKTMTLSLRTKSMFRPKKSKGDGKLVKTDDMTQEEFDYLSLVGPQGKFVHKKIKIVDPNGNEPFANTYATEPWKRLIFPGDIASASFNLMVWSLKPGSNGEAQKFGVKTELCLPVITLYKQADKEEMARARERFGGDKKKETKPSYYGDQTFTAERF